MTPESEGGSNIECFQNYTAPEVFVQGLAGMINKEDVQSIIQSQKYMLQRFEKTNEMLKNCNALSNTRYQNAVQDYKRHSQMLVEMKKDLDNIFRRIRTIKAKLANQYPQAFEVAASASRREKSKEDDEDDDGDDEAGSKEDQEKPVPLPKSSSNLIPKIPSQEPVSESVKNK